MRGRKSGNPPRNQLRNSRPPPRLASGSCKFPLFSIGESVPHRNGLVEQFAVGDLHVWRFWPRGRSSLQLPLAIHNIMHECTSMVQRKWHDWFNLVLDAFFRPPGGNRAKSGACETTENGRGSVPNSIQCALQSNRDLVCLESGALLLGCFVRLSLLHPRTIGLDVARSSFHSKRECLRCLRSCVVH